MKPDGHKYMIKHGKAMVDAIAAAIEPLEFRGEGGKTMCFDLLTHDPDAFFNLIATQQRD